MSPLEDRTVLELLRRYDLGTLAAPPQQVFGGLLHQMYQVRTTRGMFAFKRLSPVVMGYPNIRANFRLSERIATAIAAAGLPAIAALSAVTDGDVLQDIGPDTVLIYPWIDATASNTPPAPPVSAGPDRARSIGGLLGQIHALPPLRFAELLPPSPTPAAATTERTEWVFLAAEAERAHLPSAPQVRALLPQIDEWTGAARDASRALLAALGWHRAWVISHRDLDQKNIVWADDHTPYLIDWESAGYVQPAIEAVGTALDWSGQAAAALEVPTFHAFLEGYRSQAPLTPCEIRYRLQAYCGNWCGWLKFNVQRVVGAVTSDPEEKTLGNREIISTLALLHSASNNLPNLAQQFPDSC